MFRFWYRFVGPNISSIVRGIGEAVYLKQVKPYLNHYMGLVFEEICMQYLYLPRIISDAPFLYNKAGRWWGNNPIEKRQEEIDIVALDDDNILFGECKWQNAPVGMDVLKDLVKQGDLFHSENKWFYIFSKDSFTEECENYVKSKSNFFLITFQKMSM